MRADEHMLERRRRAEELMRAGHKRDAVSKRLRTEFGKGLSTQWLNDKWHEIHGTKPLQRKKPEKKRGLQPKRPVVTAYPIAAPSAPSLDAMLTGLIEKMRRDNIDHITAHADGRVSICRIDTRHVA